MRLLCLFVTSATLMPLSLVLDTLDHPGIESHVPAARLTPCLEKTIEQIASLLGFDGNAQSGTETLNKHEDPLPIMAPTASWDGALSPMSDNTV